MDELKAREQDAVIILLPIDKKTKIPIVEKSDSEEIQA